MSIASFPSVPLKHSGFRVTLLLHQSLQDIENLLNNEAEVMFELQKTGVFNQETIKQAEQKMEKV